MYTSLRKLIPGIVLLGSFATFCSAQDIPVDMHTGTPIIQVSLGGISDHDLSTSIGLVYDVSKLKLHELSDGWYGLGWQITAAGSVSREVRGLPDDLYETSGLMRRGWLYQTTTGTPIAQDIGNFSVGSDGSTSTCTDETTDNTKINSFNYTVDTEPDIFYFSAGGISGSFVFDNAGTPTIRLIPYQQIKITPTYTNYKLTAFTIATNTGMVYTFNDISSNTKLATRNSAVNDVSLMRKEYEFYKSSVNYNYAWGLTRMLSSSGAYIDYTYTTEVLTPSQEVRFGIIKNPAALTGISVRVKSLYTIDETMTRKYVTQITGSSGMKAVLTYSGASLNRVSLYDYRKGTGTPPFKEYILSYLNVKTNDALVHYRKFLSTVTEISECEKLAPYSFGYLVEAALPSFETNGKDFWGYYNGKNANTSLIPKLYVYPDEPVEHRVRLYPIPNYSGTAIVLDGATRTPSPEHMSIGALNTIAFPTGGICNIQYEANTYYDTRAAMNQYGGGLRIKRTTYYDGLNPKGNISRTFQYHDPVTNNSYGRVTSLPSFLVTEWKFRDPDYYNNATYDVTYNASLSVGEQWRRYTTRSELDLSVPDGPSVIYQYAIEKRPGAGSIKYEYDVPALYGESTNGQWSATVNKFARPNNCATMGIVSAGSAWIYPYSPNPNFNQERGQLKKTLEYSESGQLVRKTVNSYQGLYASGATPFKVWGLEYNRYGHSVDNIYLMGKYFLLTDYAKVLSKQTVTTYNPADTLKKQTQSAEYFYASTAHKLLSSTKTTLTDGTILRSSIKYPLDYGTIAANSEPALLAVKGLQDLNAFGGNRNAEPIEMVSYQQLPSQSEQVVAAKITRYENFATGGILPKENLSLSLDAPVGNFSPANIQLQSGTYKLVVDSRYELNSTVTAYTSQGRPVSAIGMSRVPAATVWGYNASLPIAEVTQAASGQFVFSDFETTTGHEFALANPYYGTGRTGQNALHPYATLTKTVTKAANTTNYAIDFWLNHNTSTPVILRVKILNANQSVTYYNDTIKVIPVTGKFKFVRKVIPVTFADATFYLEIKGEGLTQPSGSSPSLFPVIDDIAFFPEQGTLISSTYALPFGATSVTDHVQGVSTFTTYDKFGRPALTLDQDQNIRARNTYKTNSTPQQLTAKFSLSDTPYAGDPVTFEATSCSGAATFEWDWGSGSFTSGTATIDHVFASSGKYNVKLRVSASGFTSVVDSMEVTVSPKPITGMKLCTKGVKEYGCSTISNFSPACTSISGSTASFAYFRVIFEDEYPSSPSFQWKRRNAGESTWVNVGTNSDLYSYKVLPNSPTVEIMCVVTSGERTGSSPVETVIVYPCQ
jgi:hypothetical protein